MRIQTLILGFKGLSTGHMGFHELTVLYLLLSKQVKRTPQDSINDLII